MRKWIIPGLTAVAAIAAATLIKLVVGTWLARDADALYVAAVALTAWRVGLRGGLVATMLAVMAQMFFFLPPRFSIAVGRPEDVVDVLGWAAEGALVCWLIEAKKRAVVERDEMQARFFFTNPLPMCVYEEGTLVVLAANEAASKLYGYAPQELRQRSVVDLFPVEDREAAGAKLRSLHEPRHEKARHIRKNGSLLDVEAFGRPILFEGVNARVVTLIDRTGENRLETQLRHAQKMDALGQLAGGVAHDFNNMLSVMLGYASSSLEEIDETSPHHEAFTEIRRAAERSADLTKKLLAFGRRQLTLNRRVDLNAVMGENEKLLRRLLGSNVDFATRLSNGSLDVDVDPSQIDQVVMNLVVNARDAIEGARGHIEVTSSLFDVDDSFAVAHVGFRVGSYAKVCVIDDGVGMDAATQARVFEPFFTTKVQGKGTGLGLAIAFGIVEQAGGRLLVESEAGLGTTISFYLPLVAERFEPRESKAALTAEKRPNETVLVVDDESQVLEATTLMLRRAGYRVLPAESPAEAIRLAADDEPIDLLITDVVMPEMSGVDVALALRKTRPDIKVLYASGFTGGVELESCPGSFMQKPVTPRQLRKAVRDALEL